MILALALLGCKTDVSFEPYYANRHDPQITALDVTSEPGNIGGRTVTIQGSGFGTDAADLVVLVGGHNATVLSAEDTSIQITTPPGSISGGPADVVVATKDGWTDLPGGYTYEVDPPGTDGMYDGQRGYVVAENMWASCFGGLWDNPAAPGLCPQVAYVGSTGFDGTAEFFRSEWPRVQTAHWGWVGSGDASVGEWLFAPHYDVSFPSGYDDWRRHIGDAADAYSFKLVNDFDDDDTSDDLIHDVCVDPTLDPQGGDNTVPCGDDNAVKYNYGELRYCEGRDPETGPDFGYVADWPVIHDFFQEDFTDDENGPFAGVDVSLVLPANDQTGFAGMTRKLELPGSIHVRATQGFGDPDAWANSSADTCPAGDQGTTLDEDGIVFSWEPIADPAALASGSDAAQVGSWVEISLTYLPLGWYGISLGAPRASIIVPDDLNYDEATGLSHVGIPNSILLRFPSPNPQWSSYSQITDVGTLGDFDSNASYLVAEVYRVTDYRIDDVPAITKEDGTTDEVGPIVFSYVTGDLALPVDWSNPLERNNLDGCNDCVDNDHDGWADDLDPDCNTDVGGNGSTESNPTSAFTCNDGLDNNDADGVDWEDPLCDNGWSGETTCADGVDNDLDGWTDADDAECVADPGGNEAGDDPVEALCSNGADDDNDGWFDADDPGCENGADIDEGGFGTNECNDGIDNDQHGDIDALDPYCVTNGADGASEVPLTPSGRCADGTDDDDDQYIDLLDPDCEYPPGTREIVDHLDEGDRPVVPLCYDGLDNDGDGSIDADDPSCWNPLFDFAPDGFLNDEAADFGTGCTDGADEDSDGWFDGEDPDCVSSDPLTQDEVGFGTTLCNNGIDDNGDGKIDRASPYCSKAEGNFEGP